MITELKRLLVGQPIETAAQHHQRLSKRIALAVFSSDALSSVAYATEAILLALLAAGSQALGYATPIAIGIALLLITVAFSYRQTIIAYPQGGGTYIVSRENLGTVPSLVAASALLIDYVLTVAVSMSAAVAAIASAISILEPYRVELAIGLIALVTLANLRGIKESGRIFAVPTYLFVLSMFALIGVGLFKLIASGGSVPPAPPPQQPYVVEELQTISFFLLLRAFAAGCTALTGIEAIADGVPAFNKPESRNAAITLVIMAVILCTMFLGITVLAGAYQITPDGSPEPETANSQLARANRFLPRQFAQRGDRLVFSNGVVALGVFSSLLVIAFGAKEQALLHLYAVGVFLSFTLSQFGMVQRWRRLRTPGWQRNATINLIGATVTGTVLVVIASTKFLEGAWAVLLLIPIMVMTLRAIHWHYTQVAKQLSLAGAPLPTAVRRHTAVVLISGVHRGVIPALQYGLSLAPDNVTAVYVDMDPEATEKLKEKWKQWGSGIPLVVLSSPYRSLVRPLLGYIDEIDRQYDDDVLTIILPEFIPSKWWQHLLHNQTALLIKATLLFSKRVVVVSVPYHLEG